MHIHPPTHPPTHTHKWLERETSEKGHCGSNNALDVSSHLYETPVADALGDNCTCARKETPFYAYFCTTTEMEGSEERKREMLGVNWTFALKRRLSVEKCGRKKKKRLVCARPEWTLLL